MCVAKQNNNKQSYDAFNNIYFFTIICWIINFYTKQSRRVCIKTDFRLHGVVLFIVCELMLSVFCLIYSILLKH